MATIAMTARMLMMTLAPIAFHLDLLFSLPIFEAISRLFEFGSSGEALIPSVLLRVLLPEVLKVEAAVFCTVSCSVAGCVVCGSSDDCGAEIDCAVVLVDGVVFVDNVVAVVGVVLAGNTFVVVVVVVVVMAVVVVVVVVVVVEDVVVVCVVTHAGCIRVCTVRAGLRRSLHGQRSTVDEQSSGSFRISSSPPHPPPLLPSLTITQSVHSSSYLHNNNDNDNIIKHRVHSTSALNGKGC